jgi:hypothetical protein
MRGVRHWSHRLFQKRFVRAMCPARLLNDADVFRSARSNSVGHQRIRQFSRWADAVLSQRRWLRPTGLKPTESIFHRYGGQRIVGHWGELCSASFGYPLAYGYGSLRRAVPVAQAPSRISPSESVEKVRVNGPAPRGPAALLAVSRRRFVPYRLLTRCPRIAALD